MPSPNRSVGVIARDLAQAQEIARDLGKSGMVAKVAGGRHASPDLSGLDLVLIVDVEDDLSKLFTIFERTGKFGGVIALSPRLEAQRIAAAVRLGVIDYLAWPADRGELVPVVEGALSKATALVAEQVRRHRARELISFLTERERQVLELAIQGFSRDQTAEVLAISVSTVEVHRHAITRKLQVQRLLDAILIGIASERFEATVPKIPNSPHQWRALPRVDSAPPDFDAPQAGAPGSWRLNKEEADVLERICAGMSNRAMAEELETTEAMIKYRIRRLCEVTGSGNRSRLAYQAGLRDGARK